jgi:hypothetical protein
VVGRGVASPLCAPLSFSNSNNLVVVDSFSNKYIFMHLFVSPLLLLVPELPPLSDYGGLEVGGNFGAMCPGL